MFERVLNKPLQPNWIINYLIRKKKSGKRKISTSREGFRFFVNWFFFTRKKESRNVHPLIKKLFLSKSIPHIPLAGRLKHFIGAWMKMAQDPKMLDIVKGYKIPFHSKPFQSKVPSQPIVSREGEKFVKLEVKEILTNRVIRKV